MLLNRQGLASSGSAPVGGSGQNGNNTGTFPGNGTTTATPSPTPSPEPSPTPSPGLQPGPVAGIAIGSVVIGLGIGLLIAILFMGRRKQRDGHKKRSRQEAGSFLSGSNSYEPKGPATSSIAAPAPDLHLAEFLAVAKPDRELAGGLQDLNNLIQQHVETYYHIQPLSHSKDRDNHGALLHALNRLGIAAVTGADEGQVVALALDPRNRTAALCHVISAAIFGSFTFGSRDDMPVTHISLLPASVAEFAREMPPLEQYSGNSAGKFSPCRATIDNNSIRRTKTNPAISAMNQARTRWRHLTVYLLNRHRSDRGSLSPADFASHVTAQARQLVDSLAPFLGIFVEQGQTAAQESHLQRVAVECAKLGYAVFSQPDELRFSFVLQAGATGASGAAQGVVAALPGLLQIADDRGATLGNPRAILPPSVGDA